MKKVLHTSKKHITQLDEDFDVWIDGLQFDQSDSELKPDKAAERREKCENEFAFLQEYFANIFHAPFGDHHKWLRDKEEDFWMMTGFPMSGKSAYGYFGKLVKAIAEGKGGMNAVLMFDQDKAEERTRSLARVIMKNRKLCYDYNINLLQDRVGYYVFQSDFGQTTLVGVSRRMGLRSYTDDEMKRFRIMIADDLYNKNTVTSGEGKDNKKCYDFVTGEALRQMEEDGLLLWFGNFIHENCPAAYFKKEYPEYYYSLPILNEEGKPTWPEAYTLKDIEKLKAKFPYEIWMAEFMEDPITKGEIFDPGWLATININVVKLICAISAIDPAEGQSPASCDKAIITLGATEDEQEIVLDIYLRKEGWIAAFDYMLQVRSRFEGIHRIFLFENDFAQFNTAKPYWDRWRKRTGQSLPFYLYSAKTLKTEYYSSDKASRIMNLVHPHQTGIIKYSEEVKGTEDYKRFRRQYLSFNGGKNGDLDGLDAMATAHIIIPRYLSRGNFKATKEKNFKREEGMEGWFHV